MNSLFLASAAVTCGLLLSACSKGEPDAVPATADQNPVEAKTAAQESLARTYARVEIDTDAGLFWFEPRRCAIGPDADSGVMSYSIEGAGQSPDGQPIYVTVEDEDDDPSNSPEVRINVGTDQKFTTPEVVWVSNDQAAMGLKVPATKATVDDKSVSLQGVVFSRNGSDRLETKAAIRVDCAQSK